LRRVLILPRHTTTAASCRQRFLQFLPYLAGHGVECTIAPFFDDTYTTSLLTAERKKWWRFGRSILGRVAALVTARRYDLVVVHSELIPFIPTGLERLLANLAVPYVLDFDDAFFHQYDQHRLGIVRSVLAGKIGSLMKGAAVNVAGSSYLAQYARQFSRDVVVIPTVVDLDRYPRVAPATKAGPFRVGWIGSPSTTEHLQTIAPELRDFCARTGAELVAIGARRFDADGLNIRWVDWAEATEVEELSKAHVGIMPLPSTPWAEGKCAFKLIQTMACWRPAVASPVGANRQVVEDGVSGLLAGPGEWAHALDALYRDESMRNRLGVAGRLRVESDYSLKAWAPMLYDVWRRAARPRHISRNSTMRERASASAVPESLDS
jgi:glycosyltransferase involved in cell wall biosynthesis